MTTLTPTLASTLWPASEKTKLLRAVLLSVVGSLALAVSAKTQVPFYPVPMTMQTCVLLVIAMAYGPRLGLATVLLYLAEGAAGLPVFAGTPEKGIGLAYMMGPTGGYLLGYLLAALAVGRLALAGWDRNIWCATVALLIGNVLLYLPGILWLGYLFTWQKPILAWGLYPFILGDLTKLVLAVAVVQLAWKIIPRCTKNDTLLHLGERD